MYTQGVTQEELVTMASIREGATALSQIAENLHLIFVKLSDLDRDLDELANVIQGRG